MLLVVYVLNPDKLKPGFQSTFPQSMEDGQVCRGTSSPCPNGKLMFHAEISASSVWLGKVISNCLQIAGHDE